MAFDILLVDDEETFRESVKNILGTCGYDVDVCSCGKEAITALKKNHFDLVLLDLVLPDIDGLSILKEIKKISPETQVIILTAFGNIESAVHAMKIGAYDYLTKSLNLYELKMVVKRAIENMRLKMDANLYFRSKREQYSFENYVFKSDSMKEVLSLLEKAIEMDETTVLLEGETGTGKELFAKIIHYHGKRQNKPFVAINCASIPENLMESELFGHEKGAFTGATSQKKGLFEVADGGTFFLDEVGEMPPSVQAKFLRVLQEKQFRRLGGLKNIKVDVRIISATSSNLKKKVKEGVFRSDLFYRLNVFPIYLPPLRDRKEDIIPLCELFLKKFSKKLKKNVKKIDPRAKQILLSYRYPGNIRELENIIERAVILASSDTIMPNHIPLDEKGESCDEGETVEFKFGDTKIYDFEKELLKRALHISSGNITKAAKLIGISRFSFTRRMKKLGIQKK